MTTNMESQLRNILTIDKFSWDTRKLNNLKQKNDIEYSDEKYTDLIISIYISEFKRNVLNDIRWSDQLIKSDIFIKNISLKIYDDISFNYFHKITFFIKKFEKCIESDIKGFQNLLDKNKIEILNETLINLSKEVKIFEAPMSHMLRIWKIFTSRCIISNFEDIAKKYVENEDVSNFDSEFFQSIQKLLPYKEKNLNDTMNQRYNYYYISQKKDMIEFIKYLMLQKDEINLNSLKDLYNFAFYIDDFILEIGAPTIAATVKRKRNDLKVQKKNEEVEYNDNLIIELKEEIKKMNKINESDTKKVIKMLEKIIDEGIKLEEEASEKLNQNSKKIFLESLNESKNYNNNDTIEDTIRIQTNETMQVDEDNCSDSENSCSVSLRLEPTDDSLKESEATKLLLKIYENEMFSDVQINCLEHKLKANKCILGAYSQVFAEILKTSNCIDMSDLPHKVVKGMLDFVYTNKIENIEEISIKLIVIAHDYAIQGLKEICEESILKNLNLNNACDALITAHKCNCFNLKKKIMNFVFENRNIINTINGFQNLIKNYPNLIFEILCSN